MLHLDMWDILRSDRSMKTGGVTGVGALGFDPGTGLGDGREQLHLHMSSSFNQTAASQHVKFVESDRTHD